MQTSVEDAVFGSEVGAPGVIALLQAQDIERVGPELGQAEIRPRIRDRSIDGLQIGQGQMQFPAELADVGDPQGGRRAANHLDLGR